MDELFQRHLAWWQKYRQGDSSRHCLLGMLKAIRNFVNPLLAPPRIGVDNRPAVVEAIGDMLMYTWSLHHVRGFAYTPPVSYSQANLDVILGTMLVVLGRGLADAMSAATLLTHVAALADCCCIPLEEAARISIEKLPC